MPCLAKLSTARQTGLAASRGAVGAAAPTLVFVACALSGGRPRPGYQPPLVAACLAGTNMRRPARRPRFFSSHRSGPAADVGALTASLAAAVRPLSGFLHCACGRGHPFHTSPPPPPRPRVQGLVRPQHHEPHIFDAHPLGLPGLVQKVPAGVPRCCDDAPPPPAELFACTLLCPSAAAWQPTAPVFSSPAWPSSCRAARAPTARAARGTTARWPPNASPSSGPCTH